MIRVLPIRRVPSPELIIEVAQKLHVFYRAGMKALGDEPRNFASKHDHGWAHCHKKAYFLKRATMFLRPGFVPARPIKQSTAAREKWLRECGEQSKAAEERGRNQGRCIA